MKSVFRCINAVLAGSEFVRLDREIQSRNSMENGALSNAAEHEAQSRLSAEANIKSAMQSFVSCSAGIVLDSWNESNRCASDNPCFIFCAKYMSSSSFILVNWMEY